MSIMYEEAQAWCRRGIGSRYLALCQGRDWREYPDEPETFIGVAGRARPGNGRTKPLVCDDCGGAFLAVAKNSGGRKFCTPCGEKRFDARTKVNDRNKRRRNGQRERVKGEKAKVEL